MDLSPLFARRLLLLTGKGGIGKTLVAAALGQAAAASGKRTLLVESASRGQLAPLFGVTAADHEQRTVAANLNCVNLEPKDNFREYVVKHLGQRVLYDTVFSHRVVESFINTIPGLSELMLLGRLFYHCELAPEPRPDLVIFDGFASGHFMSLMTTPDAVLQSNLGGPLARETERVKSFLGDAAKCGIVFVTVPEELVVSETLDFLPRLAASAPAKILGVVVNRVPPPVADLAGSGPASGYLKRRAEYCGKALAQLRTGLEELGAAGLPLKTLLLPELGFINEPLPSNFGVEFLQARLAPEVTLA